MSSVDLTEEQLQLIVRGLAIQGLRNPGFDDACRLAAVAVYGGGAVLSSPGNALYNAFKRALQDAVEEVPGT